jgi:hypothetical protein
MLQLHGPGFNPGIFNMYRYSKSQSTVQKTDLGAENSTYKTKSVAYSQNLSQLNTAVFIYVDNETITTTALLFRRSRLIFYTALPHKNASCNECMNALLNRAFHYNVFLNRWQYSIITLGNIHVRSWTNYCHTFFKSSLFKIS